MAYVKLNRKAFFHNLDYFSKVCKSNSKLSIALKDNAYGHGLEEIAMMSKEYGIKHVFVSDQIEAMKAQRVGFDTILVLHDVPDTLDEKSYYAINSLETISSFPKHQSVELNIDTGMHRNGITLDELEDAIKLIEDNSLKLKGVFTHFCCADEDNNFTLKQEEIFQNAVSKIQSLVKGQFRIHCANSSGVHKINMDLYDIARIGIGVYGYIDLPNYEKNLFPVLSIYAKKISTRVVKLGESIGYGSQAYICKKESMTVSCYDFGYGKGFIRLGEKKRSTIEDGRAVLGRVSMDSFSIEGEDDEVCVFENVKRLTVVHDTIANEICCLISPFLKRVIV